MIDFTSPEPPEGYSDPLRSGDVARIFKVDTKTVSRWATAGRLTGFRTPGGDRRFTWAEISAVGRKCTEPEPSPLSGPAAASAILSIGGLTYRLYLAPVPAETGRPGHAGVVLGSTRSGALVTLDTTSLEWLDDLESAIQAARARGVVQGGMTAAAVQ